MDRLDRLHPCEVGTDWPIFVISLVEAKARRACILSQCDQFGLVPEIIDAVDGRQGLPPGYEVMIDRTAAHRRLGRPMTDGEFACALSHRLIYQTVIARDLPGAVILEDDAILTADFADFIRGRGYLAAPFIQMDHTRARIDSEKLQRWSPQIMLYPLLENSDAATGYAVSREAAQYILSQSPRVAGVADWPCELQPIRPLVTLPRIIERPPFNPLTSYLEQDRSKAQSAVTNAPSAPRWHRFGKRAYWKRWWLKRISK